MIRFLFVVALGYYAVVHYVDFKIGLDLIMYDIRGGHHEALAAPSGDTRGFQSSPRTAW